MVPFLWVDFWERSLYTPRMSDLSSTSNPARVFLDCEFTGFVEPQLLSLALVLNDTESFYGELWIPAEEREINAFVDEHVLTQWGKVPTAYSTPQDMAAALSSWLFWLNTDKVHVHYDYHADMDLLENLLKSAGLWETWERVLVPTHVGYLYGDERVEPFMKRRWDIEEVRTGLKPHHALADARVLRQAFRMVHDDYGV